MAPLRIHIFGASGAGTSSLGRALAERLGIAHLDTDDFFWMPTDPPFTLVRPRETRLAMLTAALDAATEGWALSGSLVGWGDPSIPRFALAVFLTLAAELRLARLRERERRRYGAAIEPGGARHTAHLDFMDWNARYDTGGPDMRSRAQHEAWIERLPCPVLRLDSAQPVAALVTAVERVASKPQGR
jgi:adenylate kinase family enzyme